jgi:hypothetical protein
VDEYFQKALFYHYEGESWGDALSSLFTGVLRGVWGYDHDTAFATGWNSILYYRYVNVNDFAAFYPPYSYPGSMCYYNTWGLSDSDMYFVKSNRVVYYYDGAALNDISPPKGFDFHGIWGFEGGPTGEVVPDPGLLLGQNYPNPFNPVTTIEFILPGAGNITLKVYNISGQHITTLAEGFHESGPHAEIWDGTDETGEAVSSGVYLYRLDTPAGAIMKKMVLLR